MPKNIQTRVVGIIANCNIGIPTLHTHTHTHTQTHTLYFHKGQGWGCVRCDVCRCNVGKPIAVCYDPYHPCMNIFWHYHPYFYNFLKYFFISVNYLNIHNNAINGESKQMWMFLTVYYTVTLTFIYSIAGDKTTVWTLNYSSFHNQRSYWNNSLWRQWWIWYIKGWWSPA